MIVDQQEHGKELLLLLLLLSSVANKRCKRIYCARIILKTILSYSSGGKMLFDDNTSGCSSDEGEKIIRKG